jgi:Tfp pilus assembly protein PilN
MQRLSLNLATRPLRNRRFFTLLGGGLGLAFLATALLAVILLFQFTLKKNSVRAGIRKADKTVQNAQAEQKRLENQLKEAAKKDQDIVAAINSIILRKRFSWTDFLSKLEDALPDSSYILSLAPTLVDDTRVQFHFQVVSQDLDGLLALINKLQELKFTRPRVETEERNERGQLASEISVTYERVL